MGSDHSTAAEPKRSRQHWRVAVLLAPATLLAGLWVSCAPKPALAASVFTTIHTFKGTDGAYPVWGGFVAGKGGSFYGETQSGGKAYAGTVFHMVPPANTGGSWTLNRLYDFLGGSDGAEPVGLLGDGKGNLIGETTEGGTGQCFLNGGFVGCGEVFELSPPAKGQRGWTKTVLYMFQGMADGGLPQHGLARDSSGNLFGLTDSGPNCGDGCGTVFELSPPTPGETAWTETTLYDFPAQLAKGFQPAGVPLLDAAGNLYGLTTQGGTRSDPRCTELVSGCGTIFRLSPPAKGATAWKQTTLWTFTGNDGLFPYSALSMDKAGNLYGLANGGGLPQDCPYTGNYEAGCGTLFELSPPADGKATWTLSLLWQFTGGQDGRDPYAAGLMPYQGDFITTTSGDEINQYGSVDMFSPPNAYHQKWREKTLFTFTNDANGENPTSLLFRMGKVFYGMTQSYSSTSPAPYGTIFSITP